MQSQHKQLLKTLIKSEIKGQLPQTLNSLSSSIKGRSCELLRTWNIYLCRYIRTKQQTKAKQILQIMQKVLHYYSLVGQMTDSYIPIMISNNGASLSQSEWNFIEAESHLEAMLEYIEVCTDKILQQQQPQFAKAAELKRLQIKVRLQLAGVYSQIQKHEKAIIMADSAVRLVYQFCINIQMNLKNSIEPNADYLKSKQKLQFLINESQPEKVTNNAGLQKIRQQLCAWKQNTDLSSIHLKKLIKGVKCRTLSLLNFQIGDIMEVTSMMSYELPSKQSILDLIVVEQLQQLTLELSVGYFTLGTQLFYQKSKKDKKSAIDKYKDIFQNEYKRQQLFHLQALTLAANTIGFETPYVQHLIKVFNDNYHGLQIIEQNYKQDSSMSIRLEDTKIEQTPIKYLLTSGVKKQNQESKQPLNDSLFDLSVNHKTKRKSEQSIRNKRSSLSTVTKNTNK